MTPKEKMKNQINSWFWLRIESQVKKMLIYPVYEVNDVKNATTENEDSKAENVESNKTPPKSIAMKVQNLKCKGMN